MAYRPRRRRPSPPRSVRRPANWDGPCAAWRLSSDGLRLEKAAEFGDRESAAAWRGTRDEAVALAPIGWPMGRAK